MVFDPALGKVVLFGGDDAAGGQLNDTWLWDGTTWTPVFTAHAPPPRWQAAGAYDAANGTIVLFGGTTPSTPYMGDTWIWSGTDWLQAFPSTSPLARYGEALAYDAPTGEVVLFGGGVGPDALADDTWLWDGSAWTEALPASSPAAREGASATYDPTSQLVLLFGGGTLQTVLNDTWTWDGTNWSQVTTLRPPPARENAALTNDDATGTLVLYGGSGSATEPSDTWLWGSTDWSKAVVAPSARAGVSEAYDPLHHQTILFGGQIEFGNGRIHLFNDTWAWNGAVWTQLQQATSPPARAYASMAYDAATSTIVLFGGGNCCFGGQMGDTWIWDGTNWHQAFPAASPPGRYGAAMAYDAAHQQVVLFGGSKFSLLVGNVFNDTWTWDGSTWAQQPTPIAPSARAFAAIAYDGADSTTVMFGGYAAATNGARLLSDTWTWDGSAWTQRNPTVAPFARQGAVAAYDPSRGTLVMFGGEYAAPNSLTSYLLGDTWTWNGATWQQLTNVSRPPPRAFAGLAYDTDSQALTLFGGGEVDEPSSYQTVVGANNTWVLP
jgi:hypothetical protein